MKKFIKEFKAFAMRGNVLDMAVGIIIGSAFTAIVNSLVNDIFMPIVGMLIGGIDFSNWAISFNGVTINFGLFLNAVISFIIIALSVFIMVKAINKITHKHKEEAPAPKPSKEVLLLEEIRDILKEK